jgi:hypothetical protein
LDSKIAAGIIVAIAASIAAAAPPAGNSLSEEEEFRVFDADLGPAWIDISAYPEEMRQTYALFARRCSKCHTLARPINSSMRGDEWIAYVNRMSRKPGSGISPKDAEAILGFLVFDSEKRARTPGQMDPELVPFVRVSEELSGVARFPASLRDIRAEDGPLRVQVEGDRRLDLSRFLESDEVQKLVKWTRRSPHRGEIVVQEGVLNSAPAAEGDEPSSQADLLQVVEEAVGSETDPRERVELILDWLDEELAREYREGTAEVSALLDDRRGDGTEFTRVFVAMSNVAGVPARERLGFVARRTAFYIHAWAEVWLDGWIPVDPYLGQLPADLTHIRLVLPDGGELADWDPQRVPGLDRLQLRVITSDAERGEGEG